MPQRYGALMALVTRFHSNALVERKHALEAYNMKTTKSRSCSITATFLSILLIVTLMAGCRPSTPENPPIDTTGSAAAEQVVREYFKYWNEKNVTELEKLMTPNRKGITWDFDNLEYIKLISIAEKKSSDKNRKVFEVAFDVKFKLGVGGGNMKDGKTTWDYLLKQDSANSPWLIYDWGLPLI